MQNLQKQCIVCTKPTNQCCSKCQKVFYCSRIHQQQHWSSHKLQCEGRINKNILGPMNGFLSDNKWIEKNTNSTISQGNEPSNQKIVIIDNEYKDFLVETNHQESEDDIDKQIKIFIELNQKRQQQRKKLIFEYAKGRQKYLLIKCNNLLIISKKIYIDYTEKMDQKLFLNYKIRTSKLIQNLSYLLDVSYVAKVYLKLLERQKLKELLFDVELPQLPVKADVYNNYSQTQVQKYKIWKQEVDLYKTCLSLLASISNATGLTTYTQNMYKQYALLIQQSYGTNQQFIAYFMIGLWYSQIKEYKKAKRCFQHCISLKQYNNSQISLSDCYYNLALTLRNLNLVEQSIDIMHSSLIIRRQRIGKNSIEASDCLQFIGKQFIELKIYSQSIDYLNQCYTIRKGLLKEQDRSLMDITQLIKRLYVLIKGPVKPNEIKMESSEDEPQQQQIEQKQIYRTVKKQRSAIIDNQHYLKKLEEDQNISNKKLKSINIEQDWIDTLENKDLQNFSELLEKCQTLSIQQAIILVLQSRFYKNLTEQRKFRFKQLNPDFK